MSNNEAQRARIILEISEERRRQIEIKGYTVDYDDAYSEGELALAAACYALHSTLPATRIRTMSMLQKRLPSEFGIAAGGDAYAAMHRCWPWLSSLWKPKDARRDLVRAAALIVADIERIDRMSAPALSALE